jgi:hypothetical protein
MRCIIKNMVIPHFTNTQFKTCTTTKHANFLSCFWGWGAEKYILSQVGVTIDGVWIGNRIC